MYTGEHAKLRPHDPAFIMAGSGETVTYGELEARSNRLAHLLRRLGLVRLDHYAIFMENNSRYLEACGAGERSGLYYTCVNSHLTAGELAYIVNNSQSRVLITSLARLDVARVALAACPKVELCLVADGPGESERIAGLEQATAAMPATPIADESIGAPDALHVGNDGTPKGRFPPASRTASREAVACARFPAEALPVSRRDDLSFSRAALSRSATWLGQSHYSDRRHRHHHGAVRSREISGTRSGATGSPTLRWFRP